MQNESDFYDLEAIFEAEHAVGFAADGLGIGVLRPNTPVLKAAQIVGSAQKEAVKIRHSSATTVVLFDTYPANDAEHLRLRVKNGIELRALESQSVIIHASAERAAHIGRVKLFAIARRGIDQFIERAVHELEPNFGLLGYACGLLDNGGGITRDVFDVGDVVGVGELAIDEFEKPFAEINLPSGMNFRIIGAVIVGTGAINLETKRQFALKKPWFFEGDHGFVGKSANFQTDAKLLAGALKERVQCC